MKRLLSFILPIFLFISANAQWPINLSIGSPSSRSQIKGVAAPVYGIQLMNSFSDTTEANTLFLNILPGVQIRVGDSIWIRNNAATAWINMMRGGGGSGSTPGIDDVLAVGQQLTTDRAIDINGNTLTISNGSLLNLGATEIRLNTTLSGASNGWVLGLADNSTGAVEWIDGTNIYTFTNGLTESSGTVKFGGTLTQNTTVNTSTYDWGFTNGADNYVKINSGILSLSASNGVEAPLGIAVGLALIIDGQTIITGIVTPSQITSDQNNYNPGYSNIATTVRLSSNASRNITGILTTGFDGQILILQNVGSNDIVLIDESASSTAGNRFAFSGNVTLTADQSITIMYDGTASRWRQINTPASGGGTPGGSSTQVQYNNSGSFGGISGATSDGTNMTFGSGNLRATSPRITTGILDANGNELFLFTATASAVNEITYANAAAGSNPSFTASGGDTDIGFGFTTKAAGTFNLRGNSTQAATLRLYEDTDDGTNYTAFKVGTQAGDVTYTLPTADGTSGYVLSTNGSGALSWVAQSGGVASVQLLRDTLSYDDGSTNIINIYKKYYGQIYNDSSWASLADFNQNGGTWGTSAGVITNTGGAGTFTQTLDIKTNLKTDSGYTCLERWVFAAKVKVTATGNGFGVGTRSYSTGGSYYIAAQINTSSGAGVIYVPTSSNTKSSASNLTISANDVIYISLERNVNKITMKMRNITTNSASISTSYTMDYATINTQNMGRFCVYAFGGSFEVDSIGISSMQTVNSDLGILGDSKGVCYGVDYYTGYASLLQNNYTVINESGGFTTSADWEKLVPEIIALAPKQVIMMNPSNDARLGVNTDSTKARYYRIEAALRAAGINVFHLDGFYETSVSPAAWVAYIHSTRSADSIFSVYSHTFNAASVSADGIHPTSFGYYLGYNEIIGENKLSFAKSLLNFSPSAFILASSDAAQDAYINLSSTTINLMKYLRLTGPAGGSNSGSLTTGNVPFTIEPISGEYFRIYANGSGTLQQHFSNVGFTSYFAVQSYQSTIDIYTGSTGAKQSFSVNGSGYITMNETGDAIDFRVEGDADPYLIYAKGSATSDKVSIGTSSVYAKLSVLSTTEQLRLLYDASNYVSFTVSSTGLLTINNTGSGSALTVTDGIIDTRIRPRTTTTASTSSLTIDSDTYDFYAVTALAADMTINAPTGTPTEFQKLTIRILDDGTSRALTWNAAFREIGVTLPASTTINKVIYVYCNWNVAASKWDVTSVVEQAFIFLLFGFKRRKLIQIKMAA